jgi:hypothetical protein
MPFNPAQGLGADLALAMAPDWRRRASTRGVVTRETTAFSLIYTQLAYYYAIYCQKTSLPHQSRPLACSARLPCIGALGLADLSLSQTIGGPHEEG